ncbi:MAG: type II toxin-antitoxin system VapC family toxin [Candidatus Scalinduaceae bacterium]
MFKKLKLYFDTSIFNFALADDVPKEKEVTQKLFDEVRKGRYEAYVSEVVIREVNRASEEKAKSLIDLINEIVSEELYVNDEVQELAKRYVTGGIIPERYEDDALHIAAASVNNLDAIISWNFAHIVKLKTKKEVVGVNAISGFKEIEIYSPWEVIE